MSAQRRRRRTTPRNRAGREEERSASGKMRGFARTPGRLRWPRRATRQRWLRQLRQLRRAPVALRLLIGILLVAGVALAVNGVYQVARKPTELFFPVSGVLAKTPQESWREYGPAFRRYATPAIAPELLAALAQVEGSGNPLVRTYWRWSWAPGPFDLYRPASSAVGMYQITDGTFAEARHYCIHHHALVQEGPWNDWHSCWFNGLYLRIVPRDAIELTAAYLDLKVNAILANDRRNQASVLGAAKGFSAIASVLLPLEPETPAAASVVEVKAAKTPSQQILIEFPSGLPRQVVARAAGDAQWYPARPPGVRIRLDRR